jgi:hypothetical protein
MVLGYTSLVAVEMSSKGLQRRPLPVMDLVARSSPYRLMYPPRKVLLVSDMNFDKAKHTLTHSRQSSETPSLRKKIT